MKKITVLGAGMVGSAIALDLKTRFDVTAVDVDLSRLRELERRKVRTILADLSRPEEILKQVARCDIVVGAVPGFMGFETVKSVISAGKDIVDISFFPEDPFELDELARKNKVTAVVDCGVAPGMSNIILGYYDASYQVRSFLCYVGGLPVARTRPFEYKAPFSPIDVIEEYTRPARYIENEKVVIRPALTDPELIDFAEIGTLEAFNTDGLRTLMKTVKIPFMKEKTLRYPGHIEKMRFLRELGLLNNDPVEINGNKIIPRDLTVKLIFPFWKLEEGEAEFTIMRIVIEYVDKGKTCLCQYDLLDRLDPVSGISSMARTTGYACTAAVNLLAEGLYEKPGISPPEYLAREKDCFERMLAYQEERKIIYHKTERKVY